MISANKTVVHIMVCLKHKNFTEVVVNLIGLTYLYKQCTQHFASQSNQTINLGETVIQSNHLLLDIIFIQIIDVL